MSSASRFLTTVAATLAALATVVAAAALAPAGASAQQIQPNPTALLQEQGCSEHYLVAVPGGANTAPGIPDFVPHGGNVFLTGVLTEAGTGGNIQPVWVSYNATPFAANYYSASEADGAHRLNATVSRLANACPEARFSFTGYSLGADITAGMLNNIAYGRGPIGPERVASAALFANPHQGGNGAALSYGTHPDSRGALGSIEGGYGELGSRVLEICNADDIVCSTDEAHRPLVEPAMRTNMAAGSVPTQEFNRILGQLGPGALKVFAGVGAHGNYSVAQQRDASNWIIANSQAPVQVTSPEPGEVDVELEP